MIIPGSGQTESDAPASNVGLTSVISFPYHTDQLPPFFNFCPPQHLPHNLRQIPTFVLPVVPKSLHQPISDPRHASQIPMWRNSNVEEFQFQKATHCRWAIKDLFPPREVYTHISFDQTHLLLGHSGMPHQAELLISDSSTLSTPRVGNLDYASCSLQLSR
jgi:hypothetical protein